MINHYRTLILNQTDQGNPNEFICPNFQSLVLPAPLLNFYSILYPKNSTRYYQQFVEFYIENLLYSANQTQFLTSFDPRITYDINKIGEYFQYNQISDPVTNVFGYQMLLTGTYNVTPTIDYYFDSWVIRQIGNGFNVTVQSTVTGNYLTADSTTPVLSSAVYIPITFTNNVTNQIPIGSTGLFAVISGDSSGWSSNSNMQWTFDAQAPLTFSYPTFLNIFSQNSTIVNAMLLYGQIDATSQNLWKSHFNSVYSLAGLFNSYVVKVNSLCQT